MGTGLSQQARCQALTLAHQLALPGAHLATGPAPRPRSSWPLPAGPLHGGQRRVLTGSNPSPGCGSACPACRHHLPQRRSASPTGHRAGALCPRGGPLRRRHESVCQDSSTLLTRACGSWGGGVRVGRAPQLYTKSPTARLPPGPGELCWEGLGAPGELPAGTQQWSSCMWRDPGAGLLLWNPGALAGTS